jgi:transcriptional regulator with XRE-family HTH domain
MGDRVKAARVVAGLTQKQVADKMHRSRHAVIEWERGVLPDAETRDALALLYAADEAHLWQEEHSRLDGLRDLSTA